MTNRLRLAGAFAFCTALNVSAQVPTITLDRGAQEFSEPFSQIGRIVELRDGRILLVDGKEKLMWLVDFAKKTQANPARFGAGPLEFNTPGILVPGASDTIVYYDILQRRFLLFSPEGVPVRTVISGSRDPMAMMSMPQPSAVDAAGHVFGQAMGMGMRMPTATGGRVDFGGSMFADSVAVVRTDLRTGRADTMTHVRHEMAQSQPKMEMTGTTMKMTVTAPDFRANDAWTALPDGRVAILRGGDYRVRFVTLGAAETLGPPVPHTLIPLTRAMQQAAMDSIRKGMVTARQAVGRSMDEARASAGGAAPPMPSIEFDVKEPAAWAPTLPPYTGMMSTPDGKIWVAVSNSVADNTSHHDVLDGRGVLIARVRRAPGETLAGVGRGFVYTIRKDADDLQYLRRYALPATIK